MLIGHPYLRNNKRKEKLTMRPKRIIAAALVIAVLFSIASFSVFASEFSDVEDHWAKEAIERWAGYSVIVGYNGFFNPDEPITRAQLAVILNKIMGYQETVPNTFGDVEETWYTDAVLKLYAAGVMVGDGKNLRPNDKVTREEAVAIIGRALGIPEVDGIPDFADRYSISLWALGYVNAFALKGYVVGYNNIFNPKGELTRAAAVVILNNILKGYHYQPGTYEGTIDGNVLVNSTDVTIKDAEIRGNLIIAPGVGQGEVTLDNVKVDGDILVRGGGENSVIFNRVTVKGAIVVKKVGDTVRIVVSGDSDVKLVVLESGAVVVNDSTGAINVTISEEIAQGAKVVLDGNFATVENNAYDLEIEAKGKIDKLQLNKSTKISGEIEVKEINIAEGADSTINDKDFKSGQSGQSYNNIPGPAPSPGGSSGGSGSPGGSGSDGNDDDNDNEVTSPDAISVTSEAALYLTEVTIPCDVEPGTDITGMVKVIKEGNTPNPNITVTITEKEDKDDYITVTTPDTVILNKQATTSDAIAVVTLTFTYGSESDSTDVTITIKAPGWISPEYVDPRFAEGYPYAEMDPETERINLYVKLKEGAASEDNPVEIFMVATDYNSSWETNVNSVIHGHLGTNSVVQSNDYPYLKITDSNEYTVETNVELTGQQDIAIYFVLRDRDAISENPTKLYFEGRMVSALDRRAPVQWTAYINDERDTIVIYYDEALDENSVPDPSPFGLVGVADARVEEVEVSNVRSGNFGVVTLRVSGIGKDEGISGLRFTYNPPEDNKLQDKADEPNACLEIINGIVKEAGVSLDRENIHISNDGKYISIKTTGAGYWYDNWHVFDITVSCGDKALEYDIDSVAETFGGYHKYNLKLKDGQEVPQDGKFTITLTPAEGGIDFAGDPLSEVTCDDLTPTNASLKFEGAEYGEDGLKLIFSRNIDPSSIPACSFVLKVNDQEYHLRGYTWASRYGDENPFVIIRFDQKNIPVAINGDDVLYITYKPAHDNMSSHEIITEISGKPLDSFEGQVRNNLNSQGN